MTQPAPLLLHNQVLAIIQHAAAVEEREWEQVKRGRRRQSPFFAFVRELRKCAAFDGLDGAAAVAKIRATLAQAGETLDQLFGDVEVEIPSAILVAWPITDLAGLLDRAARAVDALPQPIKSPVSLDYWRFRALCRHVHYAIDNQPIMLAVEALARVLGVTRRTISTWKKLAQAEGWLVLVEPADRRRRRAARYRYVESDGRAIRIP